MEMFTDEVDRSQCGGGLIIKINSGINIRCYANYPFHVNIITKHFMKEMYKVWIFQRRRLDKNYEALRTFSRIFKR